MQVIEERNGEIVYTLRIAGNRWRPPVFWDSRYTIRVGEGDALFEQTGVTPVPDDSEASIDITFEEL